FPFEREIHREVSPMAEKLHMLIVELPLDLAIGEQETLRIRSAFERQAENFAHDTMGAVGTQQMTASKFENRPGLVSGLDDDAVVRLRKASDLYIVFDVHALAYEVVDEDRFDIPLRHHEHEGVGRIEPSDIIEVKLGDLLPVLIDLRSAGD